MEQTVDGDEQDLTKAWLIHRKKRLSATAGMADRG